MNIIEQTLSRPLENPLENMIATILSLVIWEIIYHCIIKKILYKFPESDFASALLELGGFGILGTALFVGILVILLIASVQFVMSNWTAIFPLAIFWGLVGTAAFFFVRAMIRKK